MITVEVKANGILIKHILIAKEDNKLNYGYEYYRPGEMELISGKIENYDIKKAGVNLLLIKVINDILLQTRLKDKN